MNRSVSKLVLAVALMASACTSGGDGDSAATTAPSTTAALLETTTTDLVVESNYVFVEKACTELGDQTTLDITCGSVTVPADYSTGEGQFEIAVAVIASTADSPAPDPVIYLDGGPGSHSLDTLQYRFDDFYIPLAARSDVVVFDQRGAGRSEPVADCTEVNDFFRAEERSEAKSIPQAYADSVVAALAACSLRLEDAGVRIEDLNTANNARDVDAIRQALGYPTWNLLGISYGTRLGLEVVRQFPDSTRSLILDSVFPHQVDAAADNAATFARSYEAVLAACQSEEACAAQGDLGERIQAAIAKLEAEPMEVEVIDFVAQSTDVIFVDGDGLVEIINSALYSPESFSDFPELMTAIENDDPSALSVYASVERTNAEFLTVGMFLGIMCADEYGFSDYDTVLANWEDPFGLVPPELAAATIFNECSAFTSELSDPSANEPVQSDVPTLVMAGKFDPVTPPEWAELAASTLSNSQIVIFPGQSHGVSPTGCGVEIVIEFLAAPNERAEADCAQDYKPQFVAGSSLPLVELDAASVSFGGTQAEILVPKGWTTANDGFISNSRRGFSILDSAEMLQYAGPESVVDGIEESLEEQFGGVFQSVSQREIGTQTWSVKTFTAGDFTITALRRNYDGGTLVLYMFSAASEHDTLVEAVLVPAAGGFTVG